MIRSLLFLALVLGIAIPVFMVARERASESGAARRKGIIVGLVGVAVGLVAALWGPGQVRQTRGSLTSLAAGLLLWILGGGFAFLSAVLLAGAATAPRGGPSSNRTER